MTTVTLLRENNREKKALNEQKSLKPFTVVSQDNSLNRDV